VVVNDELACAQARELVSAAADDELGPDEERRLSLHLDHCPACTTYANELAVLTRTVRLRPVAARDDLTDLILARSRPPRLGRGGWMRPALAWVGVVVAVQSIGPLVFGDIDGTPTHVARHVGASALALSIGLLYAAWRPARAFGLLPLIAALFTATIVAAILDTVAGDRTAVAESVHVAELIGMVLLWFVAGSPGWERTRDVLRSLKPGGGVPHATN
jgi:predicted anti-sigma-YlaC factor YlaD